MWILLDNDREPEVCSKDVDVVKAWIKKMWDACGEIIYEQSEDPKVIWIYNKYDLTNELGVIIDVKVLNASDIDKL